MKSYNHPGLVARRLVLAAALLMPVLGYSSAQADLAPPPTYHYSTIGDLRASGKLPALTALSLADQRLMVDRAQLMLSGLYAHLDLKIEVFNADPLPRLLDLAAALKRRTTPMDQATFQDTMDKIFLDERDLHTIYEFPKPYACYTSALPFSLDRVRGPRAGSVLTAISKITPTQAILDLSPGIDRLAVGDVIEQYAGYDPVLDLAHINESQGFSVVEMGSGASPESQRRRATERLTYINQALDPFPTSNEIAVRVLKADGTSFNISFPWIVAANQQCLTEVVPPKPAGNSATDEYQLRYNQFYDPPAERALAPRPSVLPPGYPAPDTDLDLSGLQNTTETILRYKKLVKRDPKGQSDRTYGFIRLDSFKPALLSNDQLIGVISGLLTHEFAGTHGVIIDLRNNGGGWISLGERMLQLFSPRLVETEQFRLRATLDNRDFLGAAAANFPELWLQLVDLALENSSEIYTDTASLTTSAQANDLGQVYQEPVAVLTNSSCYSTCDMFSAGIQDNQIGTIWTEDRHTGGGGANNMHYSDFAGALGASSSLKYPPLPSGQEIGIAWRQAVRVGLHKGELIEDTGIQSLAGNVIPSSPADFALANLTTIQKITDSLELEASARVSSAAFIADGSTLDVPESSGSGPDSGRSSVISAMLAGTDRVELTVDGASAGSQAVSAAGATPVKVELTVPALGTSRTSGTLVLQGYLGLDAAWRRVFNYRLVPAEPVAAPTALDLTQVRPSGIRYYTSQSSVAGSGWQTRNGQLTVGTGPTYANNLQTDASWFLALPAQPSLKLSFDASVDTEKNGDYLIVTAISGGVEKELVRLSGKIAETHYDYDLAAYAGKSVELRFRFTSDESVNGSGVFVSGVSVH